MDDRYKLERILRGGPDISIAPELDDLRFQPRARATNRRETRVLPGTLDVLVLKSLEGQRLSSCEIRRRINQRTEGAVAVPQSSVLEAIKRLRGQRWLGKNWGQSAKNRSGHIYYLAPNTKSHLKAEVRRLSKKLKAILEALK